MLNNVLKQIMLMHFGKEFEVTHAVADISYQILEGNFQPCFYYYYY